MSGSNCCFLTCIQISQEAGKVVWYSHLFQKFSTVCCDPQVKVFGIVDEAEVDVFLGLFCFFDVSADVGNLTSGSSAFSKSSLNICNRFNALDLIEKVPEELWTEVHDSVQEAVMKTIPNKRKCRKTKWLFEEAFQ